MDSIKNPFDIIKANVGGVHKKTEKKKSFNELVEVGTMRKRINDFWKKAWDLTKKGGK